MHFLRPARILALTGGALFASVASAQTLVLLEQFRDDSRTNLAPPNSAMWYSSSAAGNVVYTPGSPSANGSLTQNTGSGGRHLLGFFTNYNANLGANAHQPVSLDVNEGIQLTFVVSFNTPLNVAGAFRVGLFNSAASERPTADNHGGTSNSNSAAFTNYTAYRAEMNLVPPTEAANLTIRQRFPATEGLIGANAAYTTVGSTVLNPDYAVQSMQEYTGVFTVIRTGLDSASISFTFNGPGVDNISVFQNDDSDIVSAFDAVAFSLLGNSANSFTLHEVKIETIVVPEPSTYVLFAGAGLGGLLWLRRRR